MFYYYYKTKDELFTDVLDHFFEPYRKDFEALAAEAKEKPYRALLRFFSYIKREVRAFRAKYEGNMHRTVRWAIREQTLTVIDGQHAPLDALRHLRLARATMRVRVLRREAHRAVGIATWLRQVFTTLRLAVLHLLFTGEFAALLAFRTLVAILVEVTTLVVTAEIPAIAVTTIITTEITTLAITAQV